MNLLETNLREIPTYNELHLSLKCKEEYSGVKIYFAFEVGGVFETPFQLELDEDFDVSFKDTRFNKEGKCFTVITLKTKWSKLDILKPQLKCEVDSFLLKSIGQNISSISLSTQIEIQLSSSNNGKCLLYENQKVEYDFNKGGTQSFVLYSNLNRDSTTK